MYFNGTDYYFFSGVKSVFRKMLHDDDIDNKDIIFVLKTKNFPFRSISRSINGKEKVIGIYNKAVINSYFNTKEKCEEIKRIIEYSSDDEIHKIIAELPKRKTTSSTQTKNDNKEKMIAYLDRSPEEDMDYVSNQLLIDDGVMYESKKENLSDVETEWKPKEGLFLSKSPKGIANYLLKHSKDKSQAMKRLTFYMNRAGENLKNKTVLNKVKDLLKSNESCDDWWKIEGVGYIKDRSFNINTKINEAYSDLKMLQEGDDIPGEEYLEKFPNLKLSRMLGNKLLVGDNWKRSKYRRSYYFNIDMNIDDPVFRGIKIHGLLRISDHRVNPYRFAKEFSNNYIIDVDGKRRKNGQILKIEDKDDKIKKYAFGISITLPSTNNLTFSSKNVEYEPHVFEYISNNIQDKELKNLKAKLENIVNRIETAYVGTDEKDNFSPYEYKEVAIGDTIFKISSEDHYMYDRNKLFNFITDGNVKPEKQKIRNTKTKQLDLPTKDLNYYLNIGLEPNIITVNKRKKQANQTVNYNGKIYRAIELENLLRPYNFITKSVIGFKDGLYVWKDEDENILAAAIVKNRNLKKIDL